MPFSAAGASSARVCAWWTSLWQGPAAHTWAFTWVCSTGCSRSHGLRIEAISGTSAGAMNAAVLADGWAQGEAQAARAALDAYWQRVSRARRV